MRLALAIVAVALTTPAVAATTGLPTDYFAKTWSALPTTRYTSDDGRPAVRTVAVHPGDVSGDELHHALATASDGVFRRDLAINEMASSWEFSQRSALEDLRSAYRSYVAASGAGSDERDARFAALLGRVVENSGRSVATDGGSTGEARLNEVFARVIQDAPDAALPKIEASENAWIGYRDAFRRFASVMDRPEIGREVDAELARARAGELQRTVSP